MRRSADTSVAGLRKPSGLPLESSRSSRIRIVEAGDAERRRLERDLHDGAQQRLVGLALVLRVLRTANPNRSVRLEDRLDQAENALRAVLAELRELANGIFPVALTDEGLAAALETLADSSPASIHIRALPQERLDPAVEAAVYFVRCRAPHAGADQNDCSLPSDPRPFLRWAREGFRAAGHRSAGSLMRMLMLHPATSDFAAAGLAVE